MWWEIGSSQALMRPVLLLPFSQLVLEHLPPNYVNLGNVQPDSTETSSEYLWKATFGVLGLQSCLIYEVDLRTYIHIRLPSRTRKPCYDGDHAKRIYSLILVYYVSLRT
jgi:hypothetical protein